MTEQLLLIVIVTIWAFLGGMLVGRALYRPLYLRTRDTLLLQRLADSRRVDEALEIARQFERAYNEMSKAHKEAMGVVHKYEEMIKQLTEVSR